MELKIPQNSSTVENVITGFNRSAQVSDLDVCDLVYQRVHLLFNGCLTLNSVLESTTVWDSSESSWVAWVNSADIVLCGLCCERGGVCVRGCVFIFIPNNG